MSHDFFLFIFLISFSPLSLFGAMWLEFTLHWFKGILHYLNFYQKKMLASEFNTCAHPTPFTPDCILPVTQQETSARGGHPGHVHY